LHELNSTNPLQHNPLEPIILNERLKRVQADADKQREERSTAEHRCEDLDNQNSQLRADLELAVKERDLQKYRERNLNIKSFAFWVSRQGYAQVEEGIKYRENLREWAALEERRLAQV